MADLTKLPLRAAEGLFHVVVETPRCARVKLAYDPDLECFVMSHALMLGLEYPYDWGFLPSTLGEDGYPLDALVMHDAPTSPGLVLRCRVAGALKVKETTSEGHVRRNDRFIVVPNHDHRAQDLDDVRDLPKAVKSEIKQFFEARVATEDKTLEFLGWAGPKEAMKLMAEGEKALMEKLKS
jgi:inorganic pyrophosphatase